MTDPRHGIDPDHGNLSRAAAPGDDTDPHAPVGAYVLDALTPAERRAFQAHLSTCAACQTEVVELRETLAETAVLTQTAPPPALRTEVLAAIRNVPQLGPEPRPASSPAADREAGHLPDRPPARGRDPETVVLRPARWHRIARIGVAAVLAVVLAVGGWTVGRHQQVQTTQADQAAQHQLLSAPDTRIYHQPMPGGGRVTYITSASQNAAMAVLSGRPGLQAGHVFQLWTMHTNDGRTVAEADQTFTAQPDRSVWLTGNITNAAAIAITIEPDGGSKTPTTTPFAIQQL
ncbi:hypothetical protein GCM10011575_42570 [Microlunatus endophyticus]|uniref:Regulator of SigK n=1 Tax=Microlunatus endophyticus TaxID=1716077 RepID=A0A917W960_9ACTN|nr:anti-sigma factor [Microlunatus endophyticus]GGL79730.1 hypothetical protein GCM10011575_42570 [Microlunatus endophyticus]